MEKYKVTEMFSHLTSLALAVHTYFRHLQKPITVYSFVA